MTIENILDYHGEVNFSCNFRHARLNHDYIPDEYFSASLEGILFVDGKIVLHVIYVYKIFYSLYKN